jgi:hypothetical protein
MKTTTAVYMWGTKVVQYLDRAFFDRGIWDVHFLYTLKRIADFLGVHYTTISKAVGGGIKKSFLP